MNSKMRGKISMNENIDDKSDGSFQECSRRKILILSAIDPTRAYSCIKYLYENLIKNGINVELWCTTDVGDKHILDSWGKTINSFFYGTIGKVRYIRLMYALLKGFYLALTYRNNIIICHDYLHYFSCVLVKRLFPKTILVHYCTEMINEKHARLLQIQFRYYLKNKNKMDMTIECDYYRERYRKNTYNLKKPSYTILNTIPQYEVKKYWNKYISPNPTPIVVYSGGIHSIGKLDIIVEAMSFVKAAYKLELFLYGNKKAIEAIKELCQTKLNKDSFDVISGLARNEVLEQICAADIGLMYYDPEYSANTKYAAPTKFFEYVGLGIPIVSSNNVSLRNYIKKYNLGEVMERNNAKGMADKIEFLLEHKERREAIRLAQRKAFVEELCYEKQSVQALQQINYYVCKNDLSNNEDKRLDSKF